jgi:hypothetical protein
VYWFHNRWSLSLYRNRAVLKSCVEPDVHNDARLQHSSEIQRLAELRLFRKSFSNTAACLTEQTATPCIILWFSRLFHTIFHYALRWHTRMWHYITKLKRLA